MTRIKICPEGFSKTELQYFTVVRLTDSALLFMQKESNFHSKKETGGVLIGLVENNGLIITVATGPGPNAKHGYASFKRDREYCQKKLDYWAVTTNGQWDYVGEWHKHTGISVVPSSVDINTLCYIAHAKNYHITQPVSLIISEKPENEPNFRAYLYYPGAPCIFTFKPEIIPCLLPSILKDGG